MVYLATNFGRETVNIGISKKRGFLFGRWSAFLIVEGVTRRWHA